MCEHFSRDLDQEGRERPGIPFGEDLGLLCRLDPRSGAENVVGLADDLHVGVLDAVVHHLDEVSGAVGADPAAARLAVVLR